MPCRCNGKCPHIGPARELAKAGKIGQAHGALRAALTRAPLCVEGNLMMASILGRTNRAAGALAHVERAAQSDDSPRMHFERAAALRAAVRIEEALPEFDAGVKALPDNARGVFSYIEALEVGGQLKEAQALADQARASFPSDGEILRIAAVVADAQGRTEDAAALLDRADLSPLGLLDRGRYLDRLGHHGAAWSSWMAGKAVAREKHGHIYDADRFAGMAAKLKLAATPPRPFFVRRAPELATDPAPVFVCGYPRSGTTMIETMLSSHSAIVAGDELNGIADIVENFSAWARVRVPYPDAMVAASLGENAALPTLMRDFYMLQAAERIGFAPGPRRAGKSRKKPFYFTDKMPLNELHLPLIRMLFPSAPVLRLQRHPLDVMVSCMSNWLVHGGFYASSLEACATHYKAVDDVTQHYKASFVALDKPSFKTIRYEDFVRDQNGETYNILAGLGLDIESRCLAFHDNPRRARTLSYRQVQQPLHDRSVGRWKNYRDQLAPAVEILKPILEREGYES